MQRVLIIGCSGGGKSTLARALGAKLDLPVIHIDRLFWLPGWAPRPTEDCRRLIAEALVGDRWVFDGNNTSSFDIRLPRADAIVWIDQPRWLCLWRAFARVLKGPGRTRSDMADGCAEKIDFEFYRYIWNFKRDHTPKFEAGIARYGAHLPLYRLTSDKQIAAFLASVQGAPLKGGGAPDRRA